MLQGLETGSESIGSSKRPGMTVLGGFGAKRSKLAAPVAAFLPDDEDE